ncbi:MAG: WD40 repeat domain-containing protein, partial [Planctomycetota bacterium]
MRKGIMIVKFSWLLFMSGLVYSQGDSQGGNRTAVSHVLEEGNSAAAVEALASYKVIKEYGDSRFYQGDSTKFGCFHPDSSQFAVGASGPLVDYKFTKPRLTIWTSTGQAIEHFALDVVSGMYSPDGRSLYVLDESGVVYLYDTTSWQCAASKEYTVTRPGRRRSYRITGPFLWQASKDCLALLDSGYGLRLLDANTLDVQETLPVPSFRTAAVAPDGASFLLYCDPNDANEDKRKHIVRLYETATGGLLESFGHDSLWDSPVLAIRQDNGMLAVS